MIGFKDQDMERVLRIVKDYGIDDRIVAGGDETNGHLALKTGDVSGNLMTAIGLVGSFVPGNDSEDWCECPAWLMPIDTDESIYDKLMSDLNITGDKALDAVAENRIKAEALEWLDGKMADGEDKAKAVEIITGICFRRYDREEPAEDKADGEESEAAADGNSSKGSRKGRGYSPKNDKEEAVNWLMDFHTPKIFDDGLLYVYDRDYKVYQTGSEAVKSILDELYPNGNGCNWNDIYETVRRKTKRKFRRRCSRDTRYISFLNGVYDLESRELIEPSEDLLITNQILTNYNPDAKCDVVDKYLASTFPNEEFRKLVIEYIGYCMYAENKAEKFLVLLGEGSNGKSTLKTFLEFTFGYDNLSGLSIKDMASRFGIGEGMVNRLVNIADDNDKTFVEECGNFKNMVTGDMVQAEYKGGAVFMYKPKTKMIVIANEMPRINDKTDGLGRRIMIAPLKTTFTDETKDRNLKDKLRTPEAAEYLVKLAIEGLHDLIDRDFNFIEPEEMKIAEREYKMENNPVLGFLDEVGITKFNIDEKGRSYKSVACVYNDYVNYCDDNGFKPVSKKSFGTDVLRERKDLIKIDHKNKVIDKTERAFAYASEAHMWGR